MSTRTPPPRVLQVRRAAVRPAPDEGWLRAARQARWLAWASLAWMTLEGVLGVVAGIGASSISVLTWAASSAVEGLASVIVIWRFTGHRTLSEHSERQAQRWVAGSFFLLAPYFLYEAAHRLVAGTGASPTLLAVALTASSVVLMPVFGWAKLRLGRRLESGATAGEGTQNLLCAAQALAAPCRACGGGGRRGDPRSAGGTSDRRDRAQGGRRAVARSGVRMPHVPRPRRHAADRVLRRGVLLLPRWCDCIFSRSAVDIAHDQRDQLLA